VKQYRLTVRFRFPHEPEVAAAGGEPFYEVSKTYRACYRTRAALDRRMLLFGPEPWTAYAPGAKGSDLACCSGYECGCGGLTHAQVTAAKRAGFTGEVVGFVVHERDVTPWAVAQRARYARRTAPSTRPTGRRSAAGYGSTAPAGGASARGSAACTAAAGASSSTASPRSTSAAA